MLICFSEASGCGGNHEGQFIEVNDDGAQARVLRVIGEDAHFDVVAQQVVGNVAA